MANIAKPYAPIGTGSIRFTSQQFLWIPILKRIYEFESTKVSGPGSWRRDIRDCLWTLDELVKAAGIEEVSRPEYQALIDWLVENRHAMKVAPQETNDSVRYITRVAEIARLLGHTPEYWHRGRPAVEAVRWLIEDKRVPARIVPVSKFLESLLFAISRDVRPAWRNNVRDATELAVKGVASAIGERTKQTNPKEVMFSQFQLESTVKMVLAEFGEISDKRSQVITAGVGSGKTFAFLTPVMISALARLRAGESEHRSTLLIYPRKALATDQFEVLKRVVAKINHPLMTREIQFEHYEGYQRGPEKLSVKEGIERTYGGPGPSPSIIVTTLETLKRRLQHPLFIAKIAKYLNRVVLDEVHLVEGLGGANVVRLMDRLRVACGNTKLLWTASSATVASPNEHAGIIFGLPGSKVEVLSPSDEAMSTVGLAHHIFIRPSSQLSAMGALVNLTSIIVHNRREDVGERKKPESLPKTIGFADSLDLLGRWNADLRENERTEDSRRMGKEERSHPENGEILLWKPRQREVPYAIRFRNPLQTRIDTQGGKGKPYDSVLTEYAGKNLCERCRKGERISLGKRTAKELSDLSILVYRRPAKTEDKVETFSIRNPEVFNGTSQEVGTLDLCPYLRAGACFWFPNETEQIEKIPSTSRFEWKSIARSKIHSAKTARSDNVSEDLAAIVFQASVREAYDIGDDDTAHGIPIDIVLASPSLEVGIDLQNVTESVMFHAIRNVASYRQKAGRIGREEGSDTVNATLMANIPIDLHFYRQPRKLVSLAQLDPIPLKATNQSVLRCALYAAVWDWLALKSALPEAIPTGGGPRNTKFTQELARSLDILRMNKTTVQDYLSKVSRFLPSKSDEIVDAINQVIDELGFLLTDVKEIFPEVEYLSDLIPNAITEQGVRILPKPQIRGLLQELHELRERYWEDRSKINTIDIGLSDEFKELDLMVRCGWMPEKIKACSAAISKTLDAGVEPRRALSRIMAGLSEIEEILKELGKDSLPLFFFEQLRTFALNNRAQAHYLSYILENIDVFALFRKKPEYVRVKNLFSSPYEEQVDVLLRDAHLDRVPLNEALFSLIPGHWTYRLGKNPVKTRTGPVKASAGGVLTVSLEQLTQLGSQFVVVKRKVPGPPGFREGFDVIRPTRLEVSRLSEKYLRLDHASGSIMDGDEKQFRSDSTEDRFVKIPKTYLNNWVHVEADEGQSVPVSLIDAGKLAILDSNGVVEAEGLDAAARIHHPMHAGLVSRIVWHDKLHVTEFVYSCSRTYSSKQVPGVELVFEGSAGIPVAFGRTLNSEGISIELAESTVQSIRETVTRAFETGEERWIPTGVRCFGSYLNSLSAQNSSTVSPFLVRDIVSVVLASLFSKGQPSVRLSDISGEFASLQKNVDLFMKLARQLYAISPIFEEVDRESGQILPSSVDGRTAADVEGKVNRLWQSIQSLPCTTEGLTKYADSWIPYTLLSSFGTAASTALQRLSGVTDDVVGYAVDFDKIAKSQYRVFLYDKDANGNGSSAVAKKFLHILHIQRHGDTVESKLLPSDDFLAVLEEQLLQCPQYHTDLSALEMVRQQLAGQEQTGIPALGYVRSHSKEVLANAGLTWTRLGIRGVEDSWKLAVLRNYLQILAVEKRLEIDDLVRATTICWNGCPECLLNTENVMGGVVGEQLLDKAILDEWFRNGRSKSKEYYEYDLSDIANPKTPLPFGRLSRVVLNLENRRVRSVSLPYTIGLETRRGSEISAPLLIVRTSDIEGLSLFGPSGSDVTHGIESLGFKRLFWHDLILTAYLDLLGLIPTNRKTLQAVYYDCRDISFEDIGVSPRMLDAIIEQAKASQFLEVPEQLSDMLLWLARRGFAISLCVDRSRLTGEEGIKAFVNRLISGGCSVVSKDFSGLMHKKAFVTPLGLIEGSANLTRGGTGTNEEIISYAQYGSQAYNEIAVAVKDTFHGAQRVAVTE